MKESKVFCTECRDDVTFTVSTLELTGKIREEYYNYNGRKAVCDDCGQDINVPEIRDSNLRSFYDVYRQAKGIIALDKIIELPKKYGIAKRPLSLLLGWGELTYSRYMEGKIPSKQYSDEIKRLYDEPKLYLQILENSKELISETAYRKSRKAVVDMINSSPKDKIYVISEYILHICKEITPLALQKALYYAQGLHLAFYGKPLFEDDCEAWVHGPVYREVYNKYKKYTYEVIERSYEFDNNLMDANEKAILDSVITNFCCYSGKILEDMTHAESPWRIARGSLAWDAPSREIITKESIHSYFNEVKNSYRILVPSEIRAYACDKFSEIHLQKH